MYAANRSLKPDDITVAFERYKKLSEPTARNIVRLLRAAPEVAQRTNAKNKRAAECGQRAAIDDDIVVVPSPSLAPM